MLMSDNHHDNPLCDKKLEKQHLDELERKDALKSYSTGIYSMQCRASGIPAQLTQNLDTALKVDNYLDALVKFNAEAYAPYADNIIMFGRGNHESAVMKHYNVDLTSNLIYRMRTECGCNAVAGGFGGWVRFLFTMDKTKRFSLKMKYNHGAGGEAPVTRGAIQTNRQAVYLPDADIVWNGHNHQEYVIAIARERISDAGKLYQDVQWHIRTPGYLNAYGDGSHGWAVERGMAPTPLGCVWLTMKREGDKIRIMATEDIR